VVEIMLNTPLISDLIFKGEVGEIKEIMKKSRELGMQTFDQALFDRLRGQPDQLRRRAAQRRLGQRPAPADQAQQPARQAPTWPPAPSTCRSCDTPLSADAAGAACPGGGRASDRSRPQ
jgi:hypothetical protein